MGLSKRGSANVDAIMPRIGAAVAEREKQKNENLDLGTSENWLIRKELLALYKAAVENDFTETDLSYPNGFAGDQALLDALAHFFNTYFQPHLPVLTSHLATSPGAASQLDALLYNICEPGDGVLVPGPFWNGFDWLFNVKASVQPVLVNVDCFDAIFTLQLIPALEMALREADRPIKGLVFTNPHNPMGQCYPREVIEQTLQFCEKHDLHFISDEVYAISQFNHPDSKGLSPFVSVLSLDLQLLGCDLSRVHTVWSISKDFGSSGLRMGCCVTQGNRELAVGLALASNTQMSSLTAIAATALLRSHQLGSLIAMNTSRLAEGYETITSFFKKHNIPYIPVTAGPFIFAKLVPGAMTWEEEAEALAACKACGVVVSSGRGYHVVESEKGWGRLTFAIPQEQLVDALRRLERGLGLLD